MEDVRLTVTGSDEEQATLEQFCRQRGVNTKRGVTTTYDGVAVTVIVLYLIARLDVLSRCLADYRNARNSPPKASYFLPERGQLIVQDYTPEGIAKVLREIDELHFEESDSVVPESVAA